MTGFLGGNRHEYYMTQALREAKAAFEEEEVPVGAVIVHEGSIIARAHNQREQLHDPTAHAEMIAITQAAEHLQAWRLAGCAMVVTLEPCAMCAGALVLARMDRLVFGAFDPKAGACGSVLDVIREPKLNHHIEVVSGMLENECGEILSEFFKARRAES